MTRYALLIFFLGIPLTVNAQLPTGWRAHDLSRPAPRR